MSISVVNRGASGGLSPEIVVTAPAGSTIDIILDGLIVSTYTLGADETQYVFRVRIGIYTVRGTLDTNVAETRVIVDAIAQYEAVIKYIDSVFENNTWEQIIRACETNNIPETWAVGNSKSMTINGADYLIDIIGKNHDDYSDGSGKAPLTFQMHDCFSTPYGMNSEWTNVGGWASCQMRTIHLPAIFAQMPSEVQTGVRTVNKLTSAGNSSSTINTSADKLFLLSEVEIFGSTTRSAAGEGTQYQYYSVGNSKSKTRNGSAVLWWTRSPRADTNNSFCCVLSAGTPGNSASTSLYGVAPAFCF